VPLGQQLPFDACVPAVGWVEASFPPNGAFVIAPSILSQSSQCPLGRHIDRQRPATSSETCQRRTVRETDAYVEVAHRSVSFNAAH